jgi:hypothetical protein
MTAQDRGGFAELMTGLGETYGEPVSDARMEIYFRALSDLALDAVRAAANVHVRANKFFPRPAELREAVTGSLDDAAELAWMGLLREIRRIGYLGSPTFADEAQRKAALELFGGWSRLCERLPGEGPELLGWAKQFKAIYRSYARCEEWQQLPSSAARLIES